jgi:hypothetical protein
MDEMNEITVNLNTLQIDTNVSSVSKKKKIKLIVQDDEEQNIINKGTGCANTTLKERIEWALKKPDNVVKKEGVTIKQQQEKFKNEEKKWGNEMIGQENNGQWTTSLGENLVYDVLKLLGENPRKPVSKGGFQPDWETDKYIYEVKTSNWWVSGTAGEKVLGTFIKYQNIPELYDKPLKIVCVANQEEELTNGKTVYFGENITKKTRQALDLARSWNIEYIKFSDLVLPVMSQIYK